MTDPPPPPPPPHPSSPPPPQGPAGRLPTTDPVSEARLSDIGEWLTETTRSVVVRFGELFALFVVITLPATAISAPLLWGATRDLVIVRNDDGLLADITGFTTNSVVMLVVGVAAGLIAQILVYGSATSHFDVLRSGESQPWHQSLRAGLRRLPRLLGLALAFVVVFLAVNLLGGVVVVVGLGPAAPVAIVVGLVIVWVRGGLAPTHAALAGPGSSLLASVRMTHGLTWPLLGRSILLMTLIVTLQLVGAIVSSPLQWAAGTAAPGESGDIRLSEVVGNNPASFLGTQLVSGLVTALSVAVWAAAALSLYRRLDPAGPDSEAST